MTEISLSEFAKKAPPSKKSPMSPQISMMIAGVVAVAAISFISGIQYQKGRESTAADSSTAAYRSRFDGPGGFQRGLRAIGTVIAVSSSSISIQTRGGTTSTYMLTSNTTVTDSGQNSSVSNVQNGDTVVLTLSSAGSKDVSSIVLNPSFGGFGGGFGAPGGSSDSQTNSGSNTGSNTGSSTSTTGV